MKDHLIALVEAVRLARLELACYRDPQCRATPEWTVDRLGKLLNDTSVTEAMAALVPDAESPPIVPEPQGPLGESRIEDESAGARSFASVRPH